MILHLLDLLTSKRIVLASGSPRRKQILEGIGLKIEVIPSTFEEDLEPSMFPSLKEFVIETCFQKAIEVAERLEKQRKSGESTWDLIIAADTVVALDGKVYGKPLTVDAGFEMLKKLSGKPHQVMTGVTLLWKGYSASEDVSKSSSFVDKFCEMTDVHMAPLTEDVINAYLQTQEPLDKAGGYGIQGIGGSLIQKIDGDYYNVVGFPLHRFCTVVNKRRNNL